MTMDTRELLHYEEAEKSVCGTLMSYPQLIDSVQDKLDKEAFYTIKTKATIGVLLMLNAKGLQADLTAVYSYMHEHKSNDYPQPTELSEYLNSGMTASLGQNIDIINRAYKRRQYWALGNRLMQLGYDASMSIEDGESEINRLLDNSKDTRGTISNKDANDELRKHIKMNNDNEQSTVGLATGFPTIDEKGGLQMGDFDIIAADTSQGKTTLSLNIAINVANGGTPTIMYSMEMDAMQLSARINAQLSTIPSNIILYKRMNEWQNSKVEKAMRLTDNLPIYYDDKSTTTIDSIISSIRANVKRIGIKLVVIDYMQILSTTEHWTNNELFMGDVARRLKNLAKELHICILALSQLSRDRDNPEPRLSQLRASGQIAEAADTVFLIYRPEEYGKQYRKDINANPEGTALITIAKGRNIGTGHFVCYFDKGRSLFTEEDSRAPIPIEEHAYPINDDPF